MTRRFGRGGATVSVALAALALAACTGPPPATSTPSGSAPARPSGTPGTATPPATTVPASTVPASGTGTQAAGGCGTPGTVVSTASALRAALAAARPGATIQLAPGTYLGDFEAKASGTSSAPITLCGPRSAVIKGKSIKSGYTLYLDHVAYWRVTGFTVEGGQKGVITDAADNDLINGLSVSGTGDEAIHLRDFSSHDTVSDNVVRDTGLRTAFFGEGIYVGSANKNWCRYSGCKPDASDDDVISGNDIANTTAENIDIKEGTTGGTITGNHLDGAGMNPSAATSWINVKGNDWTIAGNTGTGSVQDGLSVHQVYDGWGLGNVFKGNEITVNGPGYGIYVQSKHLQTVVYCSNKVTGARRGFSSIPCTTG